MIILTPMTDPPVVTSGVHSVRVESPSFPKPIDLTHAEALQASVWLRGLADQLEQAGLGVMRA